MTSLDGMARYKDQWYSEKVIVEPADKEGFVMLRHIKTCWGCGHPEEWSVTDSLIAFSILDQLPYPLTMESVRNDLKKQGQIEVDSV